MNRLTKYWHDFLKVFSRYVLVGATNTLICGGLMIIGAYWGLTYLEYTAFAYFITILVSFFLNMWFTFKVRGNIIRRLIYFFVLCMINVGFVEWIEYTLIEYALFKPWIAVICGMTWYSVTGFFISRYWIYK
jgi:putative flippase GtrA